MKLSVIIPVYCVENTLNRCVESVLAQHVEDMEIILIDDGSPDHCPQMCDDWARKDPRIRVIHKENGGLSDARNAGIEIAEGDYITFVDSDDHIAANTYTTLIPKMSGVDLLEYSLYGQQSLPDNSYDSAHEYWLMGQAYKHTYAWNKIYKRELFHQVRFPKGKVFEDAYTLPLLLNDVKKIITTSSGYYHYCYNPKGITATADGTALAMLLDAHLTNNMPIDDTYYMYLLNIQMDVWEQTSNPIKLPFRKLDVRHLNGKEKIKAIALNIFGIKKICIINKLIHSLKKPTRWSVLS